MERRIKHSRLMPLNNELIRRRHACAVMLFRVGNDLRNISRPNQICTHGLPPLKNISQT